MIRTVIENILLFLLPTFIYLGWVIYERYRAAEDSDGSRTGVATLLDDAPLLWLFASGAILVIVTLTLFGTFSGGQPGQHYKPSVLRDGKIEPSQID